MRFLGLSGKSPELYPRRAPGWCRDEHDPVSLLLHIHMVSRLEAKALQHVGGEGDLSPRADPAQDFGCGRHDQ